MTSNQYLEQGIIVNNKIIKSISIKPNSDYPELDEVTLIYGRMQAIIVPKSNMVIRSLTVDGREILGQRKGLVGYEENLSSFGFPLIAPWMGRLSSNEYVFEGKKYSFSNEGLKLDENGYPTHGLLTANKNWYYNTRETDNELIVEGKLVYDDAIPGYSAFPFNHELYVSYKLSDKGLEIITKVVNTSHMTVPVSFGWHPLFSGFKLEGMNGIEREINLNSKCLPVTDEYAMSNPEDFDPTAKMYKMRAGWNAELISVNDNLKLIVSTDDYPYCLVWTPPSADYIAIEPMMSNIDPFNMNVHSEPVTQLTAGKELSTNISVRVE